MSPAWCVNTNLDMRRAIPWMQFQVCSKSFILRSTEGMPGRVWQSQKPEWMEDVSAQPEAYFSRDKIAKALGVKAGFGVPIVVSTQVVAVVGLSMSKARSLDLLLIEETQAIVNHFQYELATQSINWSSRSPESTANPFSDSLLVGIKHLLEFLRIARNGHT